MSLTFYGLLGIFLCSCQSSVQRKDFKSEVCSSKEELMKVLVDSGINPYGSPRTVDLPKALPKPLIWTFQDFPWVQGEEGQIFSYEICGSSQGCQKGRIWGGAWGKVPVLVPGPWSLKVSRCKLEKNSWKCSYNLETQVKLPQEEVAQDSHVNFQAHENFLKTYNRLSEALVEFQNFWDQNPTLPYQYLLVNQFQSWSYAFFSPYSLNFFNQLPKSLPQCSHLWPMPSTPWSLILMALYQVQTQSFLFQNYHHASPSPSIQPQIFGASILIFGMLYGLQREGLFSLNEISPSLTWADKLIEAMKDLKKIRSQWNFDTNSFKEYS